jgi:hypothetical protein
MRASETYVRERHAQVRRTPESDTDAKALLKVYYNVVHKRVDYPSVNSLSLIRTSGFPNYVRHPLLIVFVTTLFLVSFAKLFPTVSSLPMLPMSLIFAGPGNDFRCV